MKKIVRAILTAILFLYLFPISILGEETKIRLNKGQQTLIALECFNQYPPFKDGKMLDLFNIELEEIVKEDKKYTVYIMFSANIEGINEHFHFYECSDVESKILSKIAPPSTRF